MTGRHQSVRGDDSEGRWGVDDDELVLRLAGIERVTQGEEPAYALVGGTTDIAPLEDRVEWGVWGLLASGHEIDTRTALKRTYSLFQGIETPDRELVLRCLTAYATQADDGRWRLRDGPELA